MAWITTAMGLQTTPSRRPDLAQLESVHATIRASTIAWRGATTVRQWPVRPSLRPAVTGSTTIVMEPWKTIADRAYQEVLSPAMVGRYRLPALVFANGVNNFAAQVETDPPTAPVRCFPNPKPVMARTTIAMGASTRATRGEVGHATQGCKECALTAYLVVNRRTWCAYNPWAQPASPAVMASTTTVMEPLTTTAITVLR